MHFFWFLFVVVVFVVVVVDDAFNVVPEVSYAIFILLFLFSIFCSAAVIFTILSSRSLICSFASVILLLILDFLIAQLVKNLPAMQETLVQFLGWENPLEKGMATHSSILAWKILTDRGSWWVTVHGVAKSQT